MQLVNNKYLRAAMLLSLILLAASIQLAGAQDSSTMHPTVEIVSPLEGAILPAGDIMINIKVENFNLTNKSGEANVAGEGHVHYFIDVPAPTTPGEPAVTAPGTYIQAITTSYNWTDVMPGMHNLTAMLVNNDHTPLDPAVYAMLNLTVVEAEETRLTETALTEDNAETLETTEITEIGDIASEPSSDEAMTY